MLLFETILLALALIIDSFTISVSFGLVEKKETIVKDMNLIGITCAIGQAIFLFLGWVFGKFISSFLAGLGPLIGFMLLTGLSIFMVIDAYKKKKNPESSHLGMVINLKILIFLVFATSFDVISVGLTLGLLQEPIGLLIIFVCIFTYISAYVGGYTGFQIGEKIGIYKGQLVGAALLFFLGLSLLIQNT
jgi:putative Mn2+ efflux pump MntP